MVAQGEAERRKPRSGTLGFKGIAPSPRGAAKPLQEPGFHPAFRRPSRADPILASRPRVSRGTTVPRSTLGYNPLPPPGANTSLWLSSSSFATESGPRITQGSPVNAMGQN